MRLAAALCILGFAGCASPPPGLEVFQSPAPACYDRSAQQQTAVVDSHLHVRPFGGAPVPFDEVMGYLRETGVRFVNIYGIGQMLPVDSPCTYYLDCVGTIVTPTLKNDFANAASLVTSPPEGVHATLAMTFPDLSRPETVLPAIELLDREFPGMFRWMGEVNLVKQALFGNGHEPVPLAAIAEWAPFMAVLRERDIPIAIHSDLGSDEEPTRYLPLMQEVLDRYPDNRIVWMHMGLSLELKTLPAAEHIELLASMLDRQSESPARPRLADHRRQLLLEGGEPAVVRRVSERVLGADPAGDGFSGVVEQGLRYLQGGAGGHQPDPPLSGRRGIPQHRAGGELLSAAGAGVRGAAGVCGGLNVNQTLHDVR